MVKLLIILAIQVNPLLGQSLTTVIKHYEDKGCCVVTKEQVTPNKVTYCNCLDSKVRLYHKDNTVTAIITEYKYVR